MAPTVHSEYTTPLLLPPSLLILPSTLSPHPLSSSSCISVSPLIRILRVNPPNFSLHSGLAFSPSAKRTIGGERQNKRPPCCWYACFGSSVLFFSLSYFYFFFTPWLRGKVTHPLPSLFLYCSFLPALSFHFLLPVMSSIHMPYLPFMDLFSTNKFLSLAKAYIEC